MVCIFIYKHLKRDMSPSTPAILPYIVKQVHGQWSHCVGKTALQAEGSESSAIAHNYINSGLEIKFRPLCAIRARPTINGVARPDAQRLE